MVQAKDQANTETIMKYAVNHVIFTNVKSSRMTQTLLIFRHICRMPYDRQVKKILVRSVNRVRQ